MKTSSPTPPTFTIACVGSADARVPSRKVIIRRNPYQSILKLQPAGASLIRRLQKHRQIGALPFREVKALRGVGFPAGWKLRVNGFDHIDRKSTRLNSSHVSESRM